MSWTEGSLEINFETGLVKRVGAGDPESALIGSARAFEMVSEAWLRAGWDAKHVYTFSWFGRPMIQLPEDMIRIQEVIYRLRPDVIVETGIAHGGSIVFYAGLCKAMGHGRVVGVDVEIRPHNREALENHEFRPYFDMIEGSSVDPAVVKQVAEKVAGAECVLVILDSNHTYGHVLAELQAYSQMVTKGSYIVATDGIMRNVAGAARSQAEWVDDNPYEAAKAFAANNPDFIVEQPVWPFNESEGLTKNVTYWPGAWIRRQR